MHVLITGGSSGIGLALARQFQAGGHRVSVIALDDQDLRRLKQQKQGFHVEAADVSEPRQLEEAIMSAQRAQGAVELLVCSAGIVKPASSLEAKEEDYLRQMQVNYLGSLWAARSVGRGMALRRKGKIVLISSMAGQVGVYGYSGYSPSKFAVKGLGEVLRQELKPHGVEVAVVYPSDVDTPMLKKEREEMPAETRAIAGIGGELSAEQAARKIIEGIERGRPEIYCDTKSRLLSRLSGVAPGLTRWIIDRQIKKAQGD